MRSFGNSSIDQWTCSLLIERGQFKPATNAAGRPIAAWFGYIQRETGRFER
jgi:protein TonB